MNARTVRFLLAGLALPGVFLVSLAGAQPPAETPAAKGARPKPVGDPYPLATCPISGKKLGSMGEPVVKLYDGREVRFCCDGCPATFEKSKEASIAKLDGALVKDQAPHYPTDTSIISGKTLGEKPLEFIYNNRLVRVADESEKAEFLKDPARHLAALDKAVISAQLKDYPLKDCVASDEGLGSMGEPKEVVVANRLIRLCCSGCRTDLRKDPAKFIAMVDEARRAKAASPGAAPPPDTKK